MCDVPAVGSCRGSRGEGGGNLEPAQQARGAVESACAREQARRHVECTENWASGSMASRSPPGAGAAGGEAGKTIGLAMGVDCSDGIADEAGELRGVLFFMKDQMYAGHWPSRWGSAGGASEDSAPSGGTTLSSAAAALVDGEARGEAGGVLA